MQIPEEGMGNLETARRYVMLEHHWNGVHYDLMLEHEGWLCTWKLSHLLQAGEQRAIELPLHRLIYLEYEGPVSGERGNVIRIASGTYQGECKSSNPFMVRLRGTLQGLLELMKEPSGEWLLTWKPAFEQID